MQVIIIKFTEYGVLDDNITATIMGFVRGNILMPFKKKSYDMVSYEPAAFFCFVFLT